MTATEDFAPIPELAPGRSCEGCTACCKLPAVEALEKPMQHWCAHCDVGRGCKIYETRPNECRSFYCGWVLDIAISEVWRPDKCRMVVKFETNRIIIYVDKDRRDAWRREPFDSQIRFWARKAAERGGDVIVWQGLEAVRVFERGEQRLGPAAKAS